MGTGRAQGGSAGSMPIDRPRRPHVVAATGQQQEWKEGGGAQVVGCPPAGAQAHQAEYRRFSRPNDGLLSSQGQQG